MITTLSNKIAHFLISASHTEPKPEQIEIYIWFRMFSEYRLYDSYSACLGSAYKYSLGNYLLDWCVFYFASSFWWITCTYTIILKDK